MQQPGTSRSRKNSLILLALIGATLFTGLAPATQAAPSPSRSVSASSQVLARMLWKKARREVSVIVRVTGLHGSVQIELDQPVEAAFGIRAARFELSLRNADGDEIDRIEGRIVAGSSRFDFDLDFPEPGEYLLSLNQSDIRIGPARIRMKPSSELTLALQAGR